ncbi:hypothetical protein NPIL_47361 [Nephila pilipes]|uniref:C2H2-type domain-containing protein n=1 Tax=Nephila pilipes TaxID=299642 RepID=A0A8X6Q5Y4_NEPPI|nr:hypothetical protein NPIL_47361 [Nephila pilipes]
MGSQWYYYPSLLPPQPIKAAPQLHLKTCFQEIEEGLSLSDHCKLLHNLKITSKVNNSAPEISTIQTSLPPPGFKSSSRTVSSQDDSKEENFIIKVNSLPPPSQDSLDDFQASKKNSFLSEEKLIIPHPLAFQNSKEIDVSPTRKCPFCNFVAEKRNGLRFHLKTSHPAERPLSSGNPVFSFLKDNPSVIPTPSTSTSSTNVISCDVCSTTCKIMKVLRVHQ